jgi:DNA-directed RNA polymerase specialized sigma24 family protein
VSTEKEHEHVAPAVGAAAPALVAPAPSGVRLTPGVSEAQLRALLARPETQEYIRSVVVARFRKDFPRADIDDIVNEANIAALRSQSRPRSMATARGWLGTVAARAVAMHFRGNAVREKYLQLDDAIDEHAGEPDAGDEPEWSVSRWLAGRVADDPRDQETYELLCYKAQTGKTHQEVAADHAMTTAALKNRFSKFTARYEPQWRKRERMLLLLWLFGIGVVAAIALWLLLHPRPVVGPDISPLPAAPKPTVTASPAPFDPAQPTAPQHDTKPRFP